VAAGSAFVASSVQNQANSATIAAATANTANTIVLRDANGDFSARSITATNFLGNATTATSAGQWTTTRTISLTGDVTGSANIDGSGNISISTTVGGNQVALGTDTTGQYARSISVSGTGISITTGSLDDGTDYTITSTATNLNTASAIVQRDSLGNFSAGTISANLQGNAATASNSTNISVTNTTANQSYYVLFVDDSATGSRAARTEADIVYNPGLNTLTIGGGSGTVNANLSGNATTATTAVGLSATGNYKINSLVVGDTSVISQAGEIRATNNITAYFSDDRLKTRLGKIENALDKVDQLNGFYYEPNQTAVDLGYEVKREVGVSAQEVEAIMPEIVAPAPIDDKYLTVRYEKLAPLLIEAIKELRAEINDIKKKLG
jgi:hypothetical protein